MSSTTASGYASSSSNATSTAPGAAQAWDVDPSHSSANFKVRHLMVSHVRGELGPVAGAVWIDDQDITRSRIDVSIDARKIATRDEKRDEHLRSADFLDVERFPTLTYRSTAIRPDGDGFVVDGDLTLHGVTRPVPLALEVNGFLAESPFGDSRVGLSASAEISRKDFGIAFDAPLEGGGVVVGDRIQIALEVEAVLQPEG